MSILNSFKAKLKYKIEEFVDKQSLVFFSPRVLFVYQMNFCDLTTGIKIKSLLNDILSFPWQFIY